VSEPAGDATSPSATTPHRRWTRFAVGAGLLVGAYVAAERVTAFDADDAVRVSADRVRVRRLVAPWDGAALLAAAWQARRADDLDTAWRGLRWAASKGVAEAPVEELRAELAAEEGDCDGARAAFDRALRARARATLDAPAPSYALGGYRLPPTLLRRCALDPR
jgi:hypothetical protein